MNNTQKGLGQEEKTFRREEEMTEYNNPGADALGRAMINNDKLDKDIEKIIANPNIMDMSERIYNLALELGATAEEAALIATEGW